MTTIFVTEPATPFVSNVLAALVRVLRTRRIRRAQRLALVTLLEMDASRLDDLGISIEDVREALSTRQPPVDLAARRNARAFAI